MVDDLFSRLEKHEAECNLRYKRIEERLNEQKETLKNLAYKIWGIGVLVVIAPFAGKFLG